jgi:hypothetical protein
MRRIMFAALCAALPFVALPNHAEANVLVRIDRATQTMDVSVDGASLYRWPVSTGRRGFGTPAGTFRPQRMAARWFSTVYYHAPMPHAIFFHGGFAIHGTTILRGWADPRRMAASACIQAPQPHCSVSCSAKARTTPQLSCTRAPRIRLSAAKNVFCTMAGGSI